ncbi:MAG: PQQ-dependent sugar dehydrogenase [Bacteroidota bacterium]
MRPYLLFLLTLAILFACNSPENPNATKVKASVSAEEAEKPEGKPQLDKIKLPEGFKVELFAEGVKNARSIARNEETGTLYIGTRSKGNVYALPDRDGDHRADEQFTLAKNLKMPNGVALRDGALFVAEVNRVIRFDGIEERLSDPPKPVVVYDKYPSEKSHGWKFISFGPDGKLYIPVGAPCNICESEDKIFNSITRINPDGTGFEIVHQGIRNTVGFTWHPENKELWFTDNGRDWMGDDMPACELNHAPKDGMHFGYPYCHQGDLPDPEFGHKRQCSEFTPPVRKLGPHVAPLGVEFIPEGNFPSSYKGQILIAEHGSWNRSKKIGYRLMLVELKDGKALSYKPFAEGWLDNDEVWGRPVDLEFLPDGSLLVSDDYAHAIYRIYYEG